MRAAVVTRYGPPDVIDIREVPDPVVGETDVLIRVRITTVNSGDARVRALKVPRGTSVMTRMALGWFRPRQPILGFEVAGEVEAVGRAVTAFKPGDRVVASRGFAFGCHAELVAVPEDGSIAILPDTMAYEDVMPVLFGGLTALNFFRLSRLKPGETILINGASGAVGTVSAQIAKQRGLKVTGVCSGGNVELVRSLGVDDVIDYTKEDFTESGRTWDVIMDTHGNAPFSKVKKLLKPGGRYLMIIGDLWQMLTAGRHPQVVNADDNKEAFSGAVYRELVTLVESGAVRPVVDSTYPFDRIAEAHARVDTGHKVGAVLVTLENNG